MSNRRLAYLAVSLIAVAALLPFIGLTDFTTKGEPREAVVALSMLNDGNWILPVNNGGDIPYKPPFFHFCIALLSMFTGHVAEYTSRLPSALSLIAMTVACYTFYARRQSTRTAVVAALFMLTAFETHRAATVCRVDMMLTGILYRDPVFDIARRGAERIRHGNSLAAGIRDVQILTELRQRLLLHQNVGK